MNTFHIYDVSSSPATLTQQLTTSSKEDILVFAGKQTPGAFYQIQQGTGTTHTATHLLTNQKYTVKDISTSDITSVDISSIIPNGTCTELSLDRVHQYEIPLIPGATRIVPLGIFEPELTTIILLSQ